MIYVQENKNKKYDAKQIELMINEMGYKLIPEISDMQRLSTPFIIFDADYYMYKIVWREFRKGKNL